MRSQFESVHSQPSPAEAREQLDRILSSPDFVLADRGRRFLKFVVNETLEGRAAYLKAFTIATSVFGRDQSFDAQNDPCVRIAAQQLRRALERYYLKSGSMDEVLIAIPTGGYVPNFAKRASDGRVRIEDEAQTVPHADTSSTEQPTAELPKRDVRLLRWIMIGAGLIILAAVAMASFAERNNAALKQAGTSADRTTILVERFTTDEETKVSDKVLSGLHSEILVDLVKFKKLVVLVEDGKPNATEATATYRLQGSIRLEGDALRAIARLVRADGAVVWSSDYNADIKGRSILDVQTAIAQSIAAAVAAPFGDSDIKPEGISNSKR
ncbi:hypothetical protein [Rhizobium sp. IBUN]|uniref:hypothetical protein n=1 Tax=Rhizobium sp. IBUN TaxID=1042326 RepID=UPI0004102CCA|nr:hypothetical protein [Rhizobium sp. IBUN]